MTWKRKGRQRSKKRCSRSCTRKTRKANSTCSTPKVRDDGAGIYLNTHEHAFPSRLSWLRRIATAEKCAVVVAVGSDGQRCHASLKNCILGPVWSKELDAWTMDFRGRVKMASKKNFQLECPDILFVFEHARTHCCYVLPVAGVLRPGLPRALTK